MNQGRTHTWDINLGYHECPNCQYIIESRAPWIKGKKEWEKTITCPRCHHSFTLTKPLKGFSLFGTSKTEFDWS